VPRSGEQVLRLYLKAGWTILGRRGSHVKVGKDGLRETIPMHKELAIGLERKLMKRLALEGFDTGERR
jgi:predicted RNA binding protein YcfA (HicA-like mRNA interferase family)